MKTLLWVITVAIYLACAIFAVFPKSNFGRSFYNVYAYAFGVGFACAMLALAIQLAVSLIASMRARLRTGRGEWKFVWAGEEWLVTRVGTWGAYFCLYLVVLAFWINLIGLAAYIVSLGKLGFLPAFRDTE